MQNNGKRPEYFIGAEVTHCREQFVLINVKYNFFNRKEAKPQGMGLKLFQNLDFSFVSWRLCGGSISKYTLLLQKLLFPGWEQIHRSDQRRAHSDWKG